VYLNLIQIAESFGVSEKVVEGWVHHEGLPCTPDRGRLLFDRAQVAMWAAARGLAAQAGFLATEPPAFAGGWRLEPLLRAGRLWRDVPASSVTSVFTTVVAGLPGATEPVRRLLAQRIGTPGGITYAPVGGGFALPHPSTRIALGRDAGVVALLFLRDPLVFAEPKADDLPVTRLAFFIAPSPRAHLDLLARLSRLLLRGPLRELVAQAAPDEAIFHAVAAAEASGPIAASREAAP
jgi:PTS system nitrogen regulatory IIA component